MLSRIVRTPCAKSCRSSRHQLHQPARALRRQRSRVEVRLLFHHQKDQVWIDVVLVSVLTNQTVATSTTSPPAARLLSGLRDPLSIFHFNTIDTSCIDEYRHRTALVPNTRRRLRCAASFDARTG